MVAAGKKEQNAYDLSFPFLLKPGGIRLIEIHPTLRCNLHCLHCYSSNNIDEVTDLSLEHLKVFLQDAATLGYRYVGVSGGEPLLWKDLDNFLAFAKAKGFLTAVTTNGTLLNRERAERLRPHTGIVSVSVDGTPEEHAAMRNSATAFDRMRHGLDILREANIPFTIAFTLTQHNANCLSWLYDFAKKAGAVALHIHPLCGFGAAKTNLSDAIPDGLEFKVASYLLAMLVEKHRPNGPAVTLDAMKRSTIEQSSWAMINGDLKDTIPFSDMVPSLVVEGDGCIVPYIYGFPRCFSLGTIMGERLLRTVETWRSKCALPVSGLFRDTLNRLSETNAEFVDLFGELLVTAASHLGTAK